MKAARDYLLAHHYGSSPRGRRPPGRQRISEDDYRAVGIPYNTPVPLAGSCLVWRWALNSQGYGVVTASGRRELAHRVAYRQANGSLPDGAQVLHLCHRPFCVQPAHLYLGDRVQNVEDREARLGKLDPDILGPMPLGGLPEVARRLQTEGRHLIEYMDSRWDRGRPVWPDPVEAPEQLTLDPPTEAECPGHEFRIPAGDAKLCSICGVSDSGLETRAELPIWEQTYGDHAVRRAATITTIHLR